MPVRRRSLLPSLIAGGMAAAVLVVAPLVSAFSLGLTGAGVVGLLTWALTLRRARP